MEYRRPYIIFEQVKPSRPNSQRELTILSQHSDVALPMNLDQVDIIDTPNLIGKPVEEPTEYCEYNLPLVFFRYLISPLVFHLYHFRFWKLCGHIWDQCFSTTLPTYRVVMDWEDQLKKFELELPTSLRYQTTQMATARPYLSLQVCMLLSARDDIHRPTSSFNQWPRR